MTNHKEHILEAINRARQRAFNGELEAALAELTGLGVSARDLPEVVYLQGMILMSMGCWQMALAHLDALLTVLPNKAVFHLDRATCFMELGRLDEAQASLERDAHMPPDQFPRRLLLARIAVRAGEVARAVAHLETACRMDKAALDIALRTPELIALLRAHGTKFYALAHPTGAN